MQENEEVTVRVAVDSKVMLVTGVIQRVLDESRVLVKYRLPNHSYPTLTMVPVSRLVRVNRNVQSTVFTGKKGKSH